MGTNIYIRVGKQPGDSHTKFCTMKSKSDFRFGGIKLTIEMGRKFMNKGDFSCE